MNEVSVEKKRKGLVGAGERIGRAREEKNDSKRRRKKTEGKKM